MEFKYPGYQPATTNFLSRGRQCWPGSEITSKSIHLPYHPLDSTKYNHQSILSHPRVQLLREEEEEAATIFHINAGGSLSYFHT